MLDKNETQIDLDYVNSFWEKLENESLNEESMDIYRYDGKVAGYVKKLKLKNEIEEIIKLLKYDLKTAKAVKIHIEIPSQSNFLPSTVLETIKTIASKDCDVVLDSLINDKLNDNGILCCILVYENIVRF